MTFCTYFALWSRVVHIFLFQDLLRTIDRHNLVKAAMGGTTATVVVHDQAEQKLQVTWLEAAVSGCVVLLY